MKSKFYVLYSRQNRSFWKRSSQPISWLTVTYKYKKMLTYLYTTLKAKREDIRTVLSYDGERGKRYYGEPIRDAVVGPRNHVIKRGAHGRHLENTISAWLRCGLLLHCSMCISTDIWWRVFHNLTEPAPYRSVCVNRRNNEARAHITIWARASIFRRFTHINVCETGYVKMWKTRHERLVEIRVFGPILWGHSGPLCHSLSLSSSSSLLWTSMRRRRATRQ